MARSSLIALLCLADCAAPAASVKVCPTMATYTQAQQTEAASELSALPGDSVLAQMITDYGALRAQVRACAAH